MGKDNTLPLLDRHEPPELTGTKPASRVWAKDFGEESRRLWQLAGPAIFTAISQYSLGALTQTFSGRIGELELAAVSVENSVISGLAFGVMVRDVKLHTCLVLVIGCVPIKAAQPILNIY